MSSEQTQKAFQRQKGIALQANRHDPAWNNNKSKKTTRQVKDIGLGLKTPDFAKTSNYVDNKCPFTSDVLINGRLIKAVVVSTKMTNTVVVRKCYLKFNVKQQRQEKRHTNISAHCSPAFKGVKIGDIVVIGGCRPLTKTVRFNVVKHQPRIVTVTNAKKLFELF